MKQRVKRDLYITNSPLNNLKKGISGEKLINQGTHALLFRQLRGIKSTKKLKKMHTSPT
jgi:hypothetical protein